jgi:hypothetical protein
LGIAPAKYTCKHSARGGTIDPANSGALDVPFDSREVPADPSVTIFFATDGTALEALDMCLFC